MGGHGHPDSGPHADPPRLSAQLLVGVDDVRIENVLG